MKNRVKKTLTYGLLLFLFGGALAQNPPSTPKVEARLSADSLMIGDQFTLDVEVEKDLTQVVDFPTFFQQEGAPGVIGETVEVLAEYPIDTLARDGRSVTIRKRYLLTAFGAYVLIGLLVINPLAVFRKETRQCRFRAERNGD